MFKNLFFQAKALPELSSQLDAGIPRYPPFLKGLPAASQGFAVHTRRANCQTAPGTWL